MQVVMYSEEALRKFKELLNCKEYEEAEKVLCCVDLTTKDAKGNTSLHMAAECGALSIIEFIFKQTGVNLNVVDAQESQTPLMLAASNGHAEVVRVLLEHGADASLFDKNGCTALILAAKHYQAQVVEVLFKAEIDSLNRSDQISVKRIQNNFLNLLSAEDDDGHRIFEKLQFQLDYSEIASSLAKAMSRMTKSKDLDAHLVVKSCKDFVKALIEADDPGVSQIFVKELCPAFSDADVLEIWQTGCLSANFDVLNAILEQCEDRNIEAINRGEILFCLMEHGIDFVEDMDFIDVDIDFKAVAKARRACDQYSPLIVALQGGRPNNILLFLNSVDDEEIRYQAPDSMTALKAACNRCILFAIEIMIERGIDIFVAYETGQNCLHYIFACEFWNDNNIVGFMVHFGEKLVDYMTAADGKGKTPLQIMLESGSERSIASILSTYPFLKEHLMDSE